MAYQNLSDEDLTALVSSGPKVAPPARTPAPDAPGYGQYLADAVAECAGCHTQRSFMTGAFTGPRFAGGAVFAVDQDPRLELVTPNLTSDAATGRVGGWSEQQFVARFRAGVLIPQTVMPWTEFGRMSDDDLRAIYRYLRTVPPVHLDQGPSLRPKR
jgi:mono/diheme cytochrome c family protein